jgi:membrane dipeptidase
VDRRSFLKGVAASGAAAAVLPSNSFAASAQEPNHLQNSDHSEALALQKSTLVVEGLVAGSVRKSHLEAQKNGGVDCGVTGLPEDPLSFARTLKFLDAHKDEYVVARTVREIQQAKQDGKISIVYGWQSADALGSAFTDPLGKPDTPLRAYYENGLRMLGIAYNVANYFGGGCLEPKIGLTRAGHRLVEEIHKLNIVLDIAGHTGEQASFDALEVSSGVPVVCSHTNVAAIADNPRCTSDKLMEAIAKTGGVIGLTAVNDFQVRSRKDAAVPHSPRVGVNAYLDQFEYVRKLVGVDHVGLGPDFIDGIPIPYDQVNREIIPREMISDGPWFYVEGFENIAQLPNVTHGLIQRGWPASDIRKVLGENWLRVYRSVWGS